MQLFTTLLAVSATVFVSVSALDREGHKKDQGSLKKRHSQKSKQPLIGGDSSVWTPSWVESDKSRHSKSSSSSCWPQPPSSSSSCWSTVRSSTSCYEPSSTSCWEPSSTSCYKPSSTSCWEPSSTSCYKPSSTSCSRSSSSKSCWEPSSTSCSRSSSSKSCWEPSSTSCYETCPPSSCYETCPPSSCYETCYETCPSSCVESCPESSESSCGTYLALTCNPINPAATPLEPASEKNPLWRPDWGFSGCGPCPNPFGYNPCPPYPYY